jgi:alkanesulfonate monooxygenase SsuD/methylene tetrahydromethanopterin reductase-like flavin-dependent oxidoreductase (luciferase family)
MMNRVGRDRGWPPLTRQQFDNSRLPQNALMVGSVQQVIDKILYEHELFGNTRFMAQASIGNVPHKLTMKSIELFGTKVVPVIRKEVG